MKKSIIALLPILCLVLWACPKDDPKPDPVKPDNRVSLLSEVGEDGIYVFFGSKNTNPYIDMTGFKNPECGVTSEFKKLKFTLVDEITTDNHPCGSFLTENYLGLNTGTAMVVDLSYYSGITGVTVDVVDGCRPGITVSLIDTDGKLIAKKVTSADDEEVRFKTRDNLDFSKIKELRILKTCEGGPQQIYISSI